jgi:hypothetical protein
MREIAMKEQNKKKGKTRPRRGSTPATDINFEGVRLVNA